MSKKKSDEQISQSIQEIMKKNPAKLVVTLEEPKQKVYESWGAKKPKK